MSINSYYSQDDLAMTLGVPCTFFISFLKLLWIVSSFFFACFINLSMGLNVVILYLLTALT